jgi:DNA-binding transcriptional ArsR family regulator
MELETAALVLDKIGNPTRLRIVRLLVRADGQGLAVGAIQKSLNIPGSTLTHHIAQLKYAGLILQEREQATLYCKLQYDQLNEVINYLTEECCSNEASLKAGKAV